jgi:hypothetical protein
MVLETNMFASYTMLPRAQTPIGCRSPCCYLVLRAGIEPTWPPGPAVLQAAAIPFCHLSTSRFGDIQLSKNLKERIRSELKAQKRPLL